MLDLPVGHRGKPGEHVAQVGVRIDAAAAATLDNGVEDGAALAGIGIAQEQPVLLTESGRPDGVFHEVVVYLDSAIFEINAKQRPIGESIIDGLAKIAARQIAAGLFEEDQSAVQTLANWTTLAHAHSGAFPWTRPAAAQVLLDAIEMSDLTQDPSTTLRCLLARFVEVASRVGPASGQGNFAFVFSDKAPVGHVSIALQGALEVCGDHVLEAVCSSARFPAIDDIAPRGERCPEVAEFGLAVARRQIADRGLVNLKVSSGHDSGADLLIDGSKPIGGQSHPASHGLPRQVNLVAVSKNGFLPVERKVSRAEEFHLRALPELDVNFSAHPAPIQATLTPVPSSQ